MYQICTDQQVRKHAGMERSDVFIVRVWHEPREITGAAPIWRGTIEHISSRSRRALKELNEIIPFITTYAQNDQLSRETLRRSRRDTVKVKIENLTGRPVSLSLNSGRVLHVSPGHTSEQIMEVEVQRNAKVEKLRDQRIIAVHGIDEETPKDELTPASDQVEQPSEETHAKPQRKSSDTGKRPEN